MCTFEWHSEVFVTMIIYLHDADRKDFEYEFTSSIRKIDGTLCKIKTIRNNSDNGIISKRYCGYVDDRTTLLKKSCWDVYTTKNDLFNESMQLFDGSSLTFQFEVSQIVQNIQNFH